MSRQDHDFCSPSQLERRRQCPGSVRLEQSIQIPDGHSDGGAAAHRGTVLHSFCRDIVSGSMAVDDVRTGTTRDGYTLVDEDAEHVAWSVGCVQEFLHSVEARHLTLLEAPVDLDYLGISGGKEGNRPDVAMVVPGFSVAVLDYKFGVGYVTPCRWNLQFKTYVAGLMRKYGGYRGLAVKIQPAADEGNRIDEHWFTADEIRQHEEEVKAIVEATKQPDAPLVRGHHCSPYCTAKPICPLYANAVLSIPRDHRVDAYLGKIGPEERRQLYDNVLAAREWIEACAKGCDRYILQGGEVPGYMIGMRNTRRKWKDGIEEALATLAVDLGKDVGDLYTKPALITPAQAEKLLGKSAPIKRRIDDMTERPGGDPVVVKDPDAPKKGLLT